MRGSEGGGWRGYEGSLKLCLGTIGTSRRPEDKNEYARKGEGSEDRLGGPAEEEPQV